MIKIHKLKSLRDICLDKIQTHDLSLVCFDGIPPHLIDLILKNVNSPNELARIQDAKTNKNSEQFAESVDERWHKFVLSIFWVGKKNQPELPPRTTWRMYYDDLERKNKENKEALTQKLQKEKIIKEKMKKKKSKIVDDQTAKQVLRTAALTQRPSSGYRSISPHNNPSYGKGARDLLKKMSKFNF